MKLQPSGSEGPQRASRRRLQQPTANSSSKSRSSFKATCERSGQHKLQRGNHHMDAKQPSSGIPVVQTRKDSEGVTVSSKTRGTCPASPPKEPRGNTHHHRDVVFEPSPREQQQPLSLSSLAPHSLSSLHASQLLPLTTAHISLPSLTDYSRLKTLRQRRVAQECVLRGQFQKLSTSSSTNSHTIASSSSSASAAAVGAAATNNSSSCRPATLPPPPLLSPITSSHTTTTAALSDESSAAAVNAYDSTQPDDAPSPPTLYHLDADCRLSRQSAPYTNESHKDASYWRCENAQLRRSLQVAQERLGQTQQQLDCLNQCLQQSYTGITHAIGHNSTMPTTTADSNRSLDTYSSWHDDSVRMLRSPSTESLLSRDDKKTRHEKGSNNKDNTSTFFANNATPAEDHPSALAERLRAAHSTILNLEIEKAGLIELLARAYVSMPLLESQQLPTKRHVNHWTMLSPPPSPTESMTETVCTLDTNTNDNGSSSATEPLEQAHATIAALRQELHRRDQAAVLSEQRLRSLELQLTEVHVQLHRQRQESHDTILGYANFLEDAVQAIKASQAEARLLQEALHRETTAARTATTGSATSQATTTGVDKRVQRPARRQSERRSSRGQGLSQ
jgi:hypothetical protein